MFGGHGIDLAETVRRRDIQNWLKARKYLQFCDLRLIIKAI
jgi:hypothetical protein